jgi:hypothetical protein
VAVAPARPTVPRQPLKHQPHLAQNRYRFFKKQKARPKLLWTGFLLP